MSTAHAVNPLSTPESWVYVTQTSCSWPVSVSSPALSAGLGYSPELCLALRTFELPRCHSDEQALCQQFDQADQSRKWREGVIKSCFNYLLLDPRSVLGIAAVAQVAGPPGVGDEPGTHHRAETELTSRNQRTTVSFIKTHVHLPSQMRRQLAQLSAVIKTREDPLAPCFR